MALHFVAGVGVEHTGAQDGGADQDVENIKHGGFPWSATNPRHAGHVALRRKYPWSRIDSIGSELTRHINAV